MRRPNPKRLMPALLLPLLLLAGCEALNDALVRWSFKDGGISDKVNEQIREGLERKLGTPENRPHETAPPFLDQG